MIGSGEAVDIIHIDDDPNARDQIFDPGFSTDPSGTGFGLRIVQEITDAHGWDIDVTESTDGGSRFEITDAETLARQ